MANPGHGSPTKVISASLVGDAYGDVAGASATIKTFGASRVSLDLSHTFGTATSIVWEVAVSPDGGLTFYVDSEFTMTAAEGLTDLNRTINLADSETHVRVRAKANADATTATVSATVHFGGASHPVSIQ
ncbi:MAG: hypothetical protein IPH13_20015 [Planctomycetes bacterium]|nr:hypothetical protein [Planctomycetota bacterium]